MAVNDYLWVSLPGNPAGLGLMSMTQEHGTQAVTDDETSGIIQSGTGFVDGGGVQVTPRGDTFVKQRNGVFTFFFKAGSEPNAKFNFFRQGAPDGGKEGYFQFSVETNNNTFGQGYVMKLNSVHLNTLGQAETFSIVQATVPLNTNPAGGGLMFQVEWTTDGSTVNALSDNLAAPELPVLNFILRAGTDSVDTDDIGTILCFNIDLNLLHNEDPTFGRKLGAALIDFGGAFHDTLQAEDAVFNNTGFDSFALAGPGSGTQIQNSLINYNSGKTFLSSQFQNMFALNANKPALVSTAVDGIGGLIEPTDVEDWTINGTGCLGWKYNILGQGELINIIQEEQWEVFSNFTPVAIQEEQWEAPPPLTPSLIQQEDWES